jgi:hypothetical protein
VSDPGFVEAPRRRSAPVARIKGYRHDKRPDDRDTIDMVPVIYTGGRDG